MKTITAVLFFGGIWGIVEATVGYVLHIIPGLSIYMTGAVLFPFAGLILYKAYQVTNSKSSLLFVGVIAAAIKAFDFFLPFNNPFKIINPMLSIIMESIALVLVISLLKKEDFASKASGLLIASVSWRLLYFAYMGIQFLTSGFVYLETFSQYLQFFGIYALGSALLGMGFIYLDQWVRNSDTKLSKVNLNHPVFSALSVIIAIALTILL